MKTYFFDILLLCIVNITFLAVGFTLNTIVIIGLYRSQLYKRLCYFLIMILAVSDLFVVGFTHPLLTVTAMNLYLNESINRNVKIALGAVKRQIILFSMTLLLTMTAERYIAIVHPFFHQKYVTKFRIVIIFLALQTPLGIAHFIFRIQEEYNLYRKCAVTTIGVLFLAMYYLNIKIFYIARKKIRCSIVPLGSFSQSLGSQPVVYKNQSEKILQRFSICLLVIICMSLCFYPHMIFRILSLELNKNWRNTTFHLWMDTLQALNSTFNCLVLLYNNSTLRRQGKVVVANWLGCKTFY